MEQTGRVVALLPGGRAQVEIQRKAACASDCSKCGGCAHPEQIMAVEVPNACGAQVGEQVVIRARASSIVHRRLGLSGAGCSNDRVLFSARFPGGRAPDFVLLGRSGGGRRFVRPLFPAGQNRPAGIV